MKGSPESSVYIAYKSFDDLGRKGAEDQARHKEKLREIVKKKLPSIISREDIVTRGQRNIKVPVGGIEIPRFRFGDQSGNGDGEGQGPGRGRQPGNQPGEDYYEVDFSLDEITELLFEDLGLPWLKPKGKNIESEEIKFDEITKKGLMPNLDKKRTIMQNIKRNAISGKDAKIGQIKPEDLRFKTYNPTVKQDSSAVIFAMRDISGSMGEFEKYISRSSYFWMVKFLRQKYDKVDIRFIVHHTEAKEVDETSFFNLGESGGTQVSSAYKLAKDIISKEYDPAQWNIYPYHFSDGENWGDTDNNECVNLIGDLLKVANMFGYAEIQERNYHSSSSLMETYSNIKDKRFVASIISKKEDIYPALKKFFSKELEGMEGVMSRI